MNVAIIAVNPIDRRWDEWFGADRQLTERDLLSIGKDSAYTTIERAWVLIHRSTAVSEAGVLKLWNLLGEGTKERLVWLVVSAAPEATTASTEPRVHFLTYRLGAAEIDERLDIRDCFRRFLRALEETPQDFAKPNWGLLYRTELPAHVLACYVCSLGDIAPLDDWKSDFENEVKNEVGSGRTGKGKDNELTWENKADIVKLRAFLTGTQVLVGQSASAPPNEAKNEQG